LLYSVTERKLRNAKWRQKNQSIENKIALSI
jgi:hypothetical protein